MIAATDPLDALRAANEGRQSLRLTREASLTGSTSYRFPLIQEGHCVFHVSDGIESLEPVPDRLWSISRIPQHVREIDENAYTPRLVSVGPLHYKKPGLEFMEAQKPRFLDRLLQRCSGFLVLDTLESCIKELEGETREFYSEDFTHIDSDRFAKMMLLDGCFVIELLRLGGMSYQGKLADDPIFATRWMPLNLGLDLLLLENQLPLQVLTRLFDLTTSDAEEDSLVNFALQFFMNLSPGKDAAVTIGSHDTDGGSPHLLALFHRSFIANIKFQSRVQEGEPKKKKEEEEPCRHIMYAGKGWIHNAKTLELSGVKFKAKPGNILDIKFRRRVLNIPPVFIDHGRTTVLKNLVAYEQQDRRTMAYFTSLVLFFSNLLCKTDDARILMKSGIIREAQNDEEEVVKFFNSIVKELAFDMNRCYLHKLIEDVNCNSQSVGVKLRSIFRTVLRRINFIEVALLIISVGQAFLVAKSQTSSLPSSTCNNFNTTTPMNS